ncbi:hypothetical protein MKX01_011553 [Papaver californicum]|nr:hypothetical protein MKX01_011553 [Papaver californicum]
MDENRVPGSNGISNGNRSADDASYWLDACEDIPCDLINDIVDFDPVVSPQVVIDDTAHQGVDFFGGIDRILESIKNGAVFSENETVVTGIESENMVSGRVIQSVEVNGEAQKEKLAKTERKIDGFCPIISGGEKKSSNAEVHGKEISHSKHERGDKEIRRVRYVEPVDRYGKRARLSDCSRHDRSKERLSKKRPRDYERTDMNRDRGRDRDKDRSSRRDHYSYSSDRKGGRDPDRRDSDRYRDRARKGYWERDRTGKVVFHSGSWEYEHEREAKRVKKENLEKCENIEKKPEEKKEKPVEELARKYQLDVLDQAKKKNTIAFLETGTGKTLIAVLLINSLCKDLMKENKKILAIFLVPKVPLVYQQAEVIRESTGYKVGHYCGEMGQDFWDACRWLREFESNQVLVMTAQIMLNILSTA